MRNQQDDHRVWYYLSIAIFVGNTWVLSEPTLAGYGLSAVCVGVGLLGGPTAAFTRLYDRGEQFAQRLPVSYRKLAYLMATLALPVIGKLQTILSELRDDIKQVPPSHRPQAA